MIWLRRWHQESQIIGLYPQPRMCLFVFIHNIWVYINNTKLQPKKNTRLMNLCEPKKYLVHLMPNFSHCCPMVHFLNIYDMIFSTLICASRLPPLFNWHFTLFWILKTLIILLFWLAIRMNKKVISVCNLVLCKGLCKLIAHISVETSNPKLCNFHIWDVI